MSTDKKELSYVVDELDRLDRSVLYEARQLKSRSGDISEIRKDIRRGHNLMEQGAYSLAFDTFQEVEIRLSALEPFIPKDMNSVGYFYAVKKGVDEYSESVQDYMSRIGHVLVRYTPSILNALNSGRKDEYNSTMWGLEQALTDESVANPAIERLKDGITGFARKPLFRAKEYTEDGLINAIEKTGVVEGSYFTK